MEGGGGLLDLMEFINKPAIIETFVDILLCAVPIWLAVMIGLVIGWSWRPRWTSLLYLGLRSKVRFIWTAPPGFGARRLWLALTALSAVSILRTLCSSLRGKPKQSLKSDSSSSSSDSGIDDDAVSEISDNDHRASDQEQIVVTENDLDHFVYLLDGKDGEISWQSLMERNTPNMAYQAWRYEPENGPTIYQSRTVFEDATAELVRDFFWDDEFRPKWDPMLIHFKILEEYPHTGAMVVHWIKKFPFFCSDREYIIGRRIWEAGKAFYCITKAVPYPSLLKRDKPRRVEHYFSSWVIKPVQSLKGDGNMTACEVTLIHYEDMGIPKDVAKLGVRHGMWGTVKKLHAGMRAYQNARKSEASLSRSALMAGITTKTSLGNDTVGQGESSEEEISRNSETTMSKKQGIDWRLVAIGGAAVLCALHTGALGKALMIGAAGRRAARG